MDMTNESSGCGNVGGPVPAKAGWFTASGRARRSEYWGKFAIVMLVLLFLVLPLILAPIIVSASEETSVSSAGVLCILLGILAALWCSVAMIPVTIRRFHDRDMSGWWVLWFWLLGMLPLVGWVAGIVQFVIVGCLDGIPGPNRYGDDPKGRAPVQPCGCRMSASGGYSAAHNPEPEKLGPEERLAQLKRMFDNGIITEAEYQEKRAQIIGEI